MEQEMTAIMHTPSFDYTQEQLDLIKATFAAGTTDLEFALFIQTCKRVQLDPFARQAFCVKRYDSQRDAYVAQTQISIDGFRVIAERSGKYEGQTAPQWCDAKGVWYDVWLDPNTPPAAARVGVYRAGWREPLYAVARWGAFVQTKQGGQVTHMWSTKGDVMLLKCAEAQALRKAFPQDLSGLYAEEEMDQADNDAPPIVSAPAATTPHAKVSTEFDREGMQARGDEQARIARELADKLINDFRAVTAVEANEAEGIEAVSIQDAARDWITANVAAADALGKVERARIAQALHEYVCSGVIEGMNGDGFRDEWVAAVAKVRGGKRGG